MKNLLTMILALFMATAMLAQQKADTVVIELAKTSKVVFTMKDRSDLITLKQYDFQALFDDLLTKLENKDTLKTDSVVAQESAPETITQNNDVLQKWSSEDDDEDDDDWDSRKYRHRGTRHSFNFDLGTNNYLEKGKFPDTEGSQYAVRPWGSWYIGLNSIQRTQVGKKFFLEWGVGISWYNFKFQDDGTILTKGDSAVSFTQDGSDVSFIKSKLSVTYLNASLIPMIDFGGYGRKARFWNYRHSSFRIGAGPYVGYRIGSHTKQVYKEDGDRERVKERSNFYLNNLRYGVRLQVGVRSADFFFNYDLNELFATDRGPKLNAFSFGVIF
jgi:hypothetical protein